MTSNKPSHKNSIAFRAVLAEYPELYKNGDTYMVAFDQGYWHYTADSREEARDFFLFAIRRLKAAEMEHLRLSHSAKFAENRLKNIETAAGEYFDDFCRAHEKGESS